MTYFHGVTVEETSNSKTEIVEQSRSIIGIVGTASGGIANSNEPVLLKSPEDVAKYFGLEKISEGETANTESNKSDQKGNKKTNTTKSEETGSNEPSNETLVRALFAIYANASPLIVAVKASELDIKKGTETDQKGIYALLKASASLGKNPKIILAPCFSEESDVKTALNTVADRLKAVALIDVPDGKNPDEAKKYAIDNAGLSRNYLFYPYINGTGKIGKMALSAFAAGVIAKNDAVNGYYTSPSNKHINGIESLAYPVNWSLSDPKSEANILNDPDGKGAAVTTVIRHGGFRLWGSRTLAKGKEEEANKFINVRRITDAIRDSVQASMLSEVDQNITPQFIQSVTESVNAYMRRLRNEGAIIDGLCYVDPNKNSVSDLKEGKVQFEIDYSAPQVSEQLKFSLILTDKYLEEVFKNV